MNAKWAEKQEAQKREENPQTLRLALMERCAHLTEHLSQRADRIDTLFGILAQDAIDVLNDVRFMAKMMESHPDPMSRIGAQEILKRVEGKIKFKQFPSKGGFDGYS